MKKIINKYWPYILILLLSVFVTWPLFKSGYFSHQDDLQVIRIYEMRRCFLDFQIPCRWVPDMGWGNGFPLFNFYGVSVYYVGALISYFVGFIGASKVLFATSLILGSFGMYLLTHKLWGRFAGVVASVLYLLAPYKALDVYVRGALAESMALAVIPFVFYFGYLIAKNTAKGKDNLLFIILLFFFLITHNIMTVLFLPVLAGWLVYWLNFAEWKNTKRLLISVILAFGLSAFFLLPAFFEKSLIQTESLLRFELDFRANYLRLYQLFLDRFWGYGTSIPGPEGGMNFSIGWPHWWLAIVSLPIIFFSKVKIKDKLLPYLIFCVFIFSIFMTHNKSTFIWENIGLLKYFQFPWRFLSLSVFTASILGGFVVSRIKKSQQTVFSLIIIVVAVIFNISYFRPKTIYQITDADKLSGSLWDEQAKGAILDYLPRTALEPLEKAPQEPVVRSGLADIYDFENFSNMWKFNALVKNKATIEVPVYYFPNWQVYVNGEEYPFSYDNLMGRITVLLDEGDYTLTGKFKNTPLRTMANTATLISVAGFSLYMKYEKDKKVN